MGDRQSKQASEGHPPSDGQSPEPSKRERGEGSKNVNSVDFSVGKVYEDRVVNIALIGVGARLQSLYVTLIADDYRRLRFVAIADDGGDTPSKRVLNIANDIEERYRRQCKHDGVEIDFDPKPTTFTSGGALFDELEERIDWVMIGSKNGEHVAHARLAIANNCHVFCEKPLAVDLDQCKEFMALEKERKRRGLRFLTGFVLRYSPFYQKLKDTIALGFVGKVITVHADELLAPSHGAYIMRNWRRFTSESGGHMVEKCCHDIDLISWLLESVPRRVASFGGTDIWKKENKPTDMTFSDYEDTFLLFDIAYETVDPFESEKDIMDNQVCIIEYEGGARVSFTANTMSAFPRRSLVICGTKGTIEADLHHGRVVMKEARYGGKADIVDFGGGSDTHGGGDKVMLDELVKLMLATHPSASPQDERSVPEKSSTNTFAVDAGIREGVMAVVTCLAIDHAARHQQILDMREFWSSQ